MDITKLVSERFPEPVLALIRPIYRRYRQVKSIPLEILDSLRVIGPDSIYNEDYYAKRKNDPWRSEAQHVVQVFHQYFTPDSVIDFGCAIGAHLEPFYERDVHIKGVEGNSKAFNHAVVPQDRLEQYDLRDRYNSGRTYDLVLCLEVAEHIPERYADDLVDTLVDAGGTIVMTAATPGQGGTHHVNEQPREYWYKKFESRGYEYDSNAVSDLRDMIEVELTDWIPDNIMVYRRSTPMPKDSDSR